MRRGGFTLALALCAAAPGAAALRLGGAGSARWGAQERPDWKAWLEQRNATALLARFPNASYLGAGVYGVAWAAADQANAGARVVLKFASATEGAQEELEHECRALQSVYSERYLPGPDGQPRLHPGANSIARCLENNTGSALGVPPHIVLEHAGDQTLKKYLQQHKAVPLSVDAAQYLWTQLQAAIAFLHDENRTCRWVHKDLHFENIMVAAGVDGEWPTLKVIDFGMATPLTEGNSHLDQRLTARAWQEWFDELQSTSAYGFEQGKNECLNGHRVTTEEGCLLAARAYGSDRIEAKALKIRPKGCYFRGGGYFFNQPPDGMGQKDKGSHLVCKRMGDPKVQLSSTAADVHSSRFFKLLRFCGQDQHNLFEACPMDPAAWFDGSKQIIRQDWVGHALHGSKVDVRTYQLEKPVALPGASAASLRVVPVVVNAPALGGDGRTYCSPP